MAKMSPTYRGLIYAAAFFVFSVTIFVIAWIGRVSKFKTYERERGTFMGIEAFRSIHQDAEIPVSPKNLTWKEIDDGKFVLEGDGTRKLSTGKVPKRFKVILTHVGDSWQVADSTWE